jgi:predicted NBD/HSP70 family sugar kinase
LRTYAGYLATGITVIVHLLDPAVVILSGGIAQNNSVLVADLNERLAGMLIAPRQRALQVQISPLGYYGGVSGAAAIAIEKFG